ncbi:MAG: 5-(carboxyamino)imidazole ribonucleotide mutase [Pseudomonadales bacterium]
MSTPFVAILMGSDSDLPVMEASFDVLDKLGLRFEARVLSAHRTPVQAKAFVQDAEERGCQVFIAAAGMAAHLAGAVAANTVKPVLGVPLSASLDGLDALLSTVQMPPGIPVGSLAIGKAGAKNAAYLAAQIVSLVDSDLAKRVRDERADNTTDVLAKDAKLQEQLAARGNG